MRSRAGIQPAYPATRLAVRLAVPFSLLVLPFAGGCAGLWDEVTSRDFKFKELIVKPSPMVVLRESHDGDKRARALRALKEPRKQGGTAEEQDAVVKILVAAATTEPQPLCRLAAIQTLATFEDPRAAPGLIEAFYAAGTFAPDTATVVRCQALTAMGKTRNPAAVELLARVVREPPAEGTEQERQQVLDLRIAAARALGQFSQYQGTEALVHVLRTEKDVALRDRAHESLQLTTGKDLPADPAAWEQLLRESQNKAVADEQMSKRKVFGLF